MHRLFSYIEEKPWHVIAILFVFHVLIASLMSWLAYSPYLSSLHNGAGFWKFSIDATLYHREALDLLAFLEAGLWEEWLEGYPLHRNTQLISLVYWLFDGTTPLFFEVLNAPTWVLSVVLIYSASYHLFEKKVETAVAASLFMFFPSVLISSTQIMRDQFYILGFCFIIYGLVVLYVYNRSWTAVIAMVVGYGFILSMREYVTPLLVFIFIPWLLTSLITRKIKIVPATVLVIMVATMSMANTLVMTGMGKAPTYRSVLSSIQTQTQTQTQPQTTSIFVRLLNDMAIKINNMRAGISAYKKASGSSIDNNVRFSTIEDVLIYLPRAMQIGFLSPFPKYWMHSGAQTGNIGRVIAGVETMLMYGVYIGFLWVLFFRLEKLYALLPILFFSVTIITLLGFAVPNVGAIYRMRQGLFIPIYMIGIYGVFGMKYYYDLKK